MEVPRFLSLSKMITKMARRRGSSKKTDKSNWIDVLGIVLVALALLTVLSLLSPSQGELTGWWLTLLRQTFGWGIYLAPVGLGGVGLWLILGRFGIEWSGRRLLAALLLFFVILALIHLPFYPNARRVAEEGQGGGSIGFHISEALISSIGLWGAYIVVLALLGIVLLILSGLSIAEIAQKAKEGWQILGDRLYYVRLPPYKVNKGTPPPSQPSATDAQPTASSPSPETTDSRRPGTVFPRIIGGDQEWRAPAISEIFEDSSEQEISQAEIRRRVRIIEETLESFGVPAKVVEVNQGPTVTQFGVEPGYIERKDSAGRVKQAKIKVSKISALANDLALALAAAPIRIEAPVPGRSIVGIEVPNVETSLVALKTVMETEVFRQLKSKLKIALGQDVAGQPIVADLDTMPHLLIAGATGSGKSVCINSIVACLLCNNTPDDLRLLMIDPKMVELTNYNGIPHLLSPVVVELERVVEVLKWTTREMDRRYKLFSRAGARNLESFNQLAIAQGQQLLYCIVVVIDELADLMMVAPDEVERQICRIAQMSRATGIHLVIATQRPSVDVVTGLIKANFPARISFAVTSQVDSRVILDAVGAEKLLGQGDMLYMASDSSKLLRLQGCFVSDRELNRLVRYWKGIRIPEQIEPQKAVQRPLWTDMIAKERAAARQEQDDLLEEAIKVVRKHNRASVSLLQRRLRIGYSRAARLIDLMEEQGVIGPQEGSGRSREVLIAGGEERADY